MKTAVKVDGTLNDPQDQDKGWSIEIKWPWVGLKELAELPFPREHGDRWGSNFSHVEWDIDIVDGESRKIPKRPEHNWVWSPQGVIDMHRPERWGYLEFSTAKPGKDNPIPTPTGKPAICFTVPITPSGPTTKPTINMLNRFANWV